MELEKREYDKILKIVEPYHKEESYELNYTIVDDIITFFSSINEFEQIPEEVIEQIASIIDGKFEGKQLVNQEYRYKFNLNPCD